MRLYEDENVNRMHEAIQLFDEICNSKWFRQTALVLFLNKSDLFKEKIEKVDLKVCFADYAGGMNYQNGVAYMQTKFKSLNRQPNKPIYIHVTCATDTGKPLPANLLFFLKKILLTFPFCRKREVCIQFCTRRPSESVARIGRVLRGGGISN